RVAFVGKGGVGKSAIAGTFARCLARSGAPVLAVDSDPMPGLAFSLGLEIDDAPIPDDAVEERAEGEEGPRFRLRRDLSPADAVERFAVTGPDGVRFLQLGKIRDAASPIFRSQFAFRQIMSGLPEDHWNLVGDLPGGTRQAFAGWGSYARTVMVVVEPTAKSTLSARRLARLAKGDGGPEVVAVANKVRDPDEADLVSRRTGLRVVASVPWDEALAEAERRRRAPIDDAPDSAAVRAVALLVDLMREQAS
ncbi:MAG: AAA family ATPase, partial [Actinobacteria bacterium]|nr:AAA family ATPase [Actinomycetota bacterium]